MNEDLISEKFKELKMCIIKFGKFYNLNEEELVFELPRYEDDYVYITEPTPEFPNYNLYTEYKMPDYIKENIPLIEKQNFETQNLEENKFYLMSKKTIESFVEVSKDEYVEFYLSKINILLPELEKLCKNNKYEEFYVNIIVHFSSWYKIFISRSVKNLTGKFGIGSSLLIFLFGIGHGNVPLLLGTVGTIISGGYFLLTKMFYNKDEEIKRFKELLNTLKI